MEFILNNKKYSILNHELFVNYLIVDNYFRHNYSKFRYDIKFDFITPLLDKEKIEFEDIHENTKVLEELIEKEEINFTPFGLDLEQKNEQTFKVTYQQLIFDNINIREDIPFLITFSSLLTYKPVVSLVQIEEELDNFIQEIISTCEKFMYVGCSDEDAEIFSNISERGQMYCPDDASPRCKEYADVILEQKGGEGVISELEYFLIGEKNIY